MLFPFRNEFDELFRGDRSIWLKMIGAALTTSLIALHPIAFDQPDFATIGIAVVGASVMGAGLAILLSLKDVVERRHFSGQHVTWLLRLYFTSGFLSCLLCIVTAMFVIVLVIVSVVEFNGQWPKV